MSRFICLVLALMLSGAALAAPAPKIKPFVTGWENPVDPDGDCKIKRDKGTLTIEMPGTIHDYDDLSKRFNAPRLLRESEGDFAMQVRLRFARRPAKETTGREHPYVAAGFLVIPPDNIPTKFCRMEYRVAGFGVSPNGYVAADFWDKTGMHGEMVGDKNWSFKGEPEHVYLRLERLDDQLRYSISPDGKMWVNRGGGQIRELPSKLKLGLAAYSTSSEPSKIQFDQLKFTQVRKKKR